MYVSIYVYASSNLKEVINVKKSKEIDLGRINGGDKWWNYIIFSKIKQYKVLLKNTHMIMHTYTHNYN